jgi:SAM-dependent methyltransferase
MDKSIFLKMLNKRNLSSDEAEAHWDSRAAHFNETQGCDASGLTEAVTDFLLERGLLQGKSVLDIGGGSGRYAIPFAGHAESMTVTDISSKMLEYADKNAKALGLENVWCEKLDWMHTTTDALGWTGKFDLVFAAMSPAIRSEEGLANMIHASKGYCLINQYVYDRDSLTVYLERELNAVRAHDPHNDRDVVYSYFNLLWMDGYTPEIHYITTEETTCIQMEDAVKRYSAKYEAKLSESGKDLRVLLEAYRETQPEGCGVKDELKSVRKSVSALILWQAHL